MKEIIRCTECEQELKNIDNAVMLELDQRTFTYTNEPVPEDMSQGYFYFGSSCAKRVLNKEKGLNCKD